LHVNKTSRKPQKKKIHCPMAHTYISWKGKP
jgi:hypothetical protein